MPTTFSLRRIGGVALLAKGTYLLRSDDSGVSSANRCPQQGPHHCIRRFPRHVKVVLDVREGSIRGARPLDEDQHVFCCSTFQQIPEKRVNSLSMISRNQAGPHLCIIFFSSITIILTDSRADDKSISSLTTMIQGSCSVFERQRYLIVGITLYL